MCDIGIVRYSCPFFLSPRSSAIIVSNMLDPTSSSQEPPIEYGKWAARNMRKKYVEWRDAFPELSEDEEEKAAKAATS